MEALFVLFQLALTVVMILGLIRPNWALPNRMGPSRLKVIGVYTGAFLGATVIAVALMPAKPIAVLPQIAVEAKPMAPVTPPQAEPMVVTGLGLTRTKAMGHFEKVGFTFENAPLINRERWMGRSNAALVDVIGPARNVEKITILAAMVNDDAANLKQFEILATVLVLAFPGWKERGQWLVNSIKDSGGRTSRDGRDVEVTLMPGLGLMLSIGQ